SSQVGGHSLAAVEVAGRLAQSLGRDVAPRAVLEAPTLAALARTIDTGPPPPVPNSSGPTRSRCRSLRHSAGCGCSIAPNPTVPTTSCRSSSGSANPSTQRALAAAVRDVCGSARSAADVLPGRDASGGREQRGRRGRDRPRPLSRNELADGSDGGHPGRST
ncbi:hypothetical protein GS421_03430, partial [Rhodococcus hoagii]|nr:hypothetical protein [Prescottella equi]